MVSMALVLTSEATIPSRTYFYPPRTRTPHSTEVVLYNGIDVTGLTTMTSRLDSPLEHFGKDKGTPYGILSHTEPPEHHQPPNHHGQLQHSRQGGAWLCHDNQRIHIH